MIDPSTIDNKLDASELSSLKVEKRVLDSKITLNRSAFNKSG
jgi:hypothetical protein